MTDLDKKSMEAFLYLAAHFKGSGMDFALVVANDNNTTLRASSKKLGMNIEAAINEIGKRVHQKRRAERN